MHPERTSKNKCIEQQEQQRVALGPGNGGNSFLVARWHPPQAAACRDSRVRRCCGYGRCRGRPLLLQLMLLCIANMLIKS